MTFAVGTLVRLDRRWRAAVLTPSLDTAYVEISGKLTREGTAVVLEVVPGTTSPELVRLLTSDGQVGWTTSVNLEMVP